MEMEEKKEKTKNVNYSTYYIFLPLEIIKGCKKLSYKLSISFLESNSQCSQTIILSGIITLLKYRFIPFCDYFL